MAAVKIRRISEFNGWKIGELSEKLANFDRNFEAC